MPPERLEHDPFDALGDPHRRAIIEVLSSGERSVLEISEDLPISRPAVSRHLRLLKQAGLVVDEARGNRRIYSLDVAGVETIQDYMREMWGEAAIRFKLASENTKLENDETD